MSNSFALLGSALQLLLQTSDLFNNSVHLSAVTRRKAQKKPPSTSQFTPVPTGLERFQESTFNEVSLGNAASLAGGKSLCWQPAHLLEKCGVFMAGGLVQALSRVSFLLQA